MTILMASILACWLTILLAPDTTTGRTLRRLLVDAPADRLSRITRGDVACGIVLAVGIALIAFVGETDKARMLILAMPDIAIWITTFEFSAIVDIVFAVTVAMSSLPIRGLGTRLASRVRRPRTRVRRPRPPMSANDDDRHGAAALAA